MVRKDRTERAIDQTVLEAKERLAAEKKKLVEQRHAERFAQNMSESAWISNPLAKYM